MDLEKIRRDTPYCIDKLFFNSAGSSLPPRIVTEAMCQYLKEEEKYGGYKLAELKKEVWSGFYKETAK